MAVVVTLAATVAPAHADQLAGSNVAALPDDGLGVPGAMLLPGGNGSSVAAGEWK
jgi:hypothetical protein